MIIIEDIRRRPVAALVTICLIGLGVGLGIWQLHRAQYKENIAAALEKLQNETPLNAADRIWTLQEAEHHPMIAKGRYLPKKAIWLENRPHPLGRDPKTGITVGFYLLMPLMLNNPDQTIIWVNRGWAPRSFNDITKVPEVTTPTGDVVIQGTVFDNAGKSLQLAGEARNIASDGHLIQENLDLASIDQPSGHIQLPFVLRQDGGEDDGLQRLWAAPNLGVEKHLGYAFQWFALAAMSFIFWIVAGLRASKKTLR